MQLEVDVPGEAFGVRPAPAPKDFLADVARDPDVQDWLISVSQNDMTRGEYLAGLARFLHWSNWTPSKL